MRLTASSAEAVVRVNEPAKLMRAADGRASEAASPENRSEWCVRIFALGLPVVVAAAVLGERLIGLVASDGGARLVSQGSLVVYYALWICCSACDRKIEQRIAALAGVASGARPFADSLLFCIAAVAVVMAARGVRMSVLVAAGLWVVTAVRRRRLSVALETAKRAASSMRMAGDVSPVARQLRMLETTLFGRGQVWCRVLGAVSLGVVTASCFLPFGIWAAEPLGLGSWRSIVALGLLSHVIAIEGTATFALARRAFAVLDAENPSDLRFVGGEPIRANWQK